MSPQDIAVVRELIVHARANGWGHIVYGGSFGVEHVWRKRGSGARFPAKIAWYDETVCYYAANREQVKATLTTTDVVEVRAWLRLLGVLPSVARIAEAVLAA